MRTFNSGLMVVAALLMPALAQKSTNPFAGRWDFNITTPRGTHASWLGVTDKGGNPEVWELSGGAGGPRDDSPRVELLEANDYLGGTLATTTFAGRTIDLGADGFLARRPEATSLVEELGWKDRLEPIAASGSSIWLRGALYELPSGLALGVPTSSAMVRSVPK